MQAILIIAHSNIEQVTELANLLSKRFVVYIHFDKKLILTKGQKIELNKERIYCYQEFSVNWGAYSLVKTELFLMKKAMETPEISYIHLISGLDWPAKSIDEIYNFFEDNNKIYMSWKCAEGIKKSGEPIIYWQKFYFPYDKINRRTRFGKIYHRCSMLIQWLLHVDKLRNLKERVDIYTGAQWKSITREAVLYCIKYVEEHQDFTKMISTGFCSDEFYMQTILCNAPDFKKCIVNDNLRYVKWVRQYNSYPAILDERDYREIKEGNYFFIRKVDRRYSRKLMDSFLI